MSDQEKRADEVPSEKPSSPPGESKSSDPSEPPKKPKYVFKIAPADPKNAFDFEDVADK